MKGLALKSLCATLTVAVAACAGASSQQLAQNVPIVNQRPSLVAVYPFAVDASDVTLNQSIVQKGYRSVVGSDQTSQQQQLAEDTAQDLCLGTVTALQQKGYHAICHQRGVPISGNVLIIDGTFLNVSEGNRLRRMVIGLGAGASTVDTNVDVYHKTDAGVQRLLEFSTHADSGKMPGAAITGAPGMAVGGTAAAVSAGVNVAAAGVKAHRSSLGFLTDKIADEIADKVSQYYAQQGWAP